MSGLVWSLAALFCRVLLLLLTSPVSVCQQACQRTLLCEYNNELDKYKVNANIMIYLSQIELTCSLETRARVDEPRAAVQLGNRVWSGFSGSGCVPVDYSSSP